MTGRHKVGGPLVDLIEGDTVSWGDDTTFIDSSNEFDDNFLASMVINDFKLSNVVVFLHDSQEFDEDFGDGSEKNLFLSFSLSIDDSFECVSQDVNLNHKPTIKINNIYIRNNVFAFMRYSLSLFILNTFIYFIDFILLYSTDFEG